MASGLSQCDSIPARIATYSGFFASCDKSVDTNYYQLKQKLLCWTDSNTVPPAQCEFFYICWHWVEVNHWIFVNKTTENTHNITITFYYRHKRSTGRGVRYFAQKGLALVTALP